MHVPRVIALSLLLFTSSGRAVSEPERPSLQPLRHEEDWSPLRDPALRQFALDPLKFMALSDDGRVWLTLGGETRQRYEYFQNANWGAGPQDEDGYWLQRYMLHGDIHYRERLRLFTQFKSGLVLGRTGGASPVDRDDFDLHQLFGEAVLSEDSITTTLRAGRQEMAFGSQRLISTREGPNVRLSFDGIRVSLRTGTQQWDAFAVRPAETEPGVFDDGTDQRRALWGVYGVTPLPFLAGAHGDFYYLGVEREQAMFNQGAARELRHSFGTRLWGQRSGWDFNYECVFQAGTFGPGRIRAWTVALDNGFTWTDARLRPRLGFKANITSGDRDPGDPDLETFNPLFPRGAYFSEPALIGPANHMDLHPTILVQPTPSITVEAGWDFFWRQSAGDGVYGNGVNLVRSSGGGGSRYVGSGPDITTSWRFGPYLTWSVSYAHFFAGPFLADQPPGEDVDYVSTWLTFRF